jgi:AcrR family transcriptional regulator
VPKVSQDYLQERREQILDAALLCFGRKGFHATTMRDICDEAGASPGAVYRYFKSKAEFIDAVTAQYADRLHDLVRQVNETSRDAKEGLQRIGQHYYGLFHEPEFFDLARADAELHAQTLRSEELQRVAQRMLGSTREAFSALIEQVPGPESYTGQIAAETVANLVISLWFGLQYTKAVDPEHVDTDAVFALLQTLLSQHAGATP